MRYEYTQELAIALEGEEEITAFIELVNELTAEMKKPGFNSKMKQGRKDLIDKFNEVITDNTADNCAGD